MEYVNMNPLKDMLTRTEEYGALLTEYGRGEEFARLTQVIKATLTTALEEAKAIAEGDISPDEPNDYPSIRRLCPGGNVKKPVPDISDIEERMAGAVLGRFIGCTLGAPVEMWSIEQMQALADYCGMDFPPTDYWIRVEKPWETRYLVDKREAYSKAGMNGVPVDDDVTYTILGLLILEKYGPDFTTEQVAEIWKELLPMAYTAEDVALKNLKAGIPANEAGEVNNPYCQWIGADIRADGFAFGAAGNPELAAKWGYLDAYLTHRRNGIYGEMFFAAAEAAAFTVDDPVEAIKIAMKEIPKTCALYRDIEWALEIGPGIKDYLEARQAVDKRFPGMSPVHTNNNACLTIFGLMLGGGDFTKTISDVVAMGLDNDCTAATAGSIIGAIVGRKGISPHWTAPFHDKVRTYLNGLPEFSIEDLIRRFVALAASN